MSSTDGPGAGLRASDADRHTVVTQLQDAVARGLLTTDEGSERMAAAYQARHLGELPPLTADLPAPPVPVATAPTPAGWRALLAMVWMQLRPLIAGSGSRTPSRRRLAASAASSSPSSSCWCWARGRCTDWWTVRTVTPAVLAAADLPLRR